MRLLTILLWALLCVVHGTRVTQFRLEGREMNVAALFDEVEAIAKVHDMSEVDQAPIYTPVTLSELDPAPIYTPVTLSELAPIYTPVTGQCEVDHGGFLLGHPDYNLLECNSLTSGAFNATAAALHNLRDCAQFVQETCGGKAAFVSYEAGKTCEWFSSAKCHCTSKTPTDCPSPNFMTAEIARLLVAPESVGHGVAVAPLGTPLKDGSTVEDVTTVGYTGFMTVNDLDPPGALALQTVESPLEIDMRTLRESDSAIRAEQIRVGEVESGCPNGIKTAIHRGEWQCVAKHPFVVHFVLCIVLISLAVLIVAAVSLHLIGGYMRSRKGADTEDYYRISFAEEEEEEEEIESTAASDVPVLADAPSAGPAATAGPARKVRLLADAPSAGPTATAKLVRKVTLLADDPSAGPSAGPARKVSLLGDDPRAGPPVTRESISAVKLGGETKGLVKQATRDMVAGPFLSLAAAKKEADDKNNAGKTKGLSSPPPLPHLEEEVEAAGASSVLSPGHGAGVYSDSSAYSDDDDDSDDDSDIAARRVSTFVSSAIDSDSEHDM